MCCSPPAYTLPVFCLPTAQRADEIPSGSLDFDEFKKSVPAQTSKITAVRQFIIRNCV